MVTVYFLTFSALYQREMRARRTVDIISVTALKWPKQCFGAVSVIIQNSTNRCRLHKWTVATWFQNFFVNHWFVFGLGLTEKYTDIGGWNLCPVIASLELWSFKTGCEHLPLSEVHLLEVSLHRGSAPFNLKQNCPFLRSDTVLSFSFDCTTILHWPLWSLVVSH